MTNDYNKYDNQLANQFQNSQIYSTTQPYSSHKNYGRIQNKNNNNGNKHKINDNFNGYEEENIGSKTNRLDSEIKQREHMEIEIIPQDDNWGVNTTSITGDFSDFNDDMTEDGRSLQGHLKEEILFDSENRSIQSCQKSKYCGTFWFHFKNYFNFLFCLFVSICAFATPFFFIILPQMNINNKWTVSECGLECEGLLIGITFKLFILFFGSYAIFARKPTSFLPQVFELRTMLVLLLCIMTFSFWLFYIVRIIFTQNQDYHKILKFTTSYVDVLLFIFVLSVFVIHIRPMKHEFIVKILRSPDGENTEHVIGNMSIQRAANWILEQYYKDFAFYNPWLENMHRKRGLGVYDKKGKISRQQSQTDRNDDENDAISLRSKKSNRRGADSVIGGNFSANDRFFEEYEYERRLRKRRARLLTTTEVAFTHIKRYHGQHDNSSNNFNLPSTVMDPLEAAQAVFTSIAKDLRRYLRITRKQPFFTRDSIIAHLANCISYDMSPKSFLQRYLNNEPIVFNEKILDNTTSRRQSHSSRSLNSHNGVNYHLNLKTVNQSWILICDTPLYQNLEDNVMFVLKQNEVCLMCTFKRIPVFNLIEDILDPKRNKFVLKLNSETTV